MTVDQRTMRTKKLLADGLWLISFSAGNWQFLGSNTICSRQTNLPLHQHIKKSKQKKKIWLHILSHSFLSENSQKLVDYWLLTAVPLLPVCHKNKQCLHVNSALFMFGFSLLLFLIYVLMCQQKLLNVNSFRTSFINAPQCHVKHWIPSQLTVRIEAPFFFLFFFFFPMI